jgi:hypothetical protein
MDILTNKKTDRAYFPAIPYSLLSIRLPAQAGYSLLIFTTSK